METETKAPVIKRIWTERITSLDEVPDAVMIRKTVFLEEQKLPEEVEFDEWDFKSPHLVVYLDEKPVGTARLIFKDGKCKYSRVAVLKEARGKGIGRIIIEELEKKAKSEGLKEVYLESQATAIGFYEKCGYESYGELFILDTIEHKMMKKTFE